MPNLPKVSAFKWIVYFGLILFFLFSNVKKNFFLFFLNYFQYKYAKLDILVNFIIFRALFFMNRTNLVDFKT